MPVLTDGWKLTLVCNETRTLFIQNGCSMFDTLQDMDMHYMHYAELLCHMQLGKFHSTSMENVTANCGRPAPN